VRNSHGGVLAETTTVAYLFLISSCLFGGLSLLGLGVFLFFGSLELLPLRLSPHQAIAWDTFLSFVFFVQHRGMIRKSFRKRLEAVLPRLYHPAFYSAMSGVVLIILLVFWQQSDVAIWSATGLVRWVIHGLYAAGIVGFWWGVVALKSFDALGLRPLLAALRVKSLTSMPLSIRGPYRFVRHPHYICMLVFGWACPHFTLDRLLFAILWSGWVIVGSILEERDLVAEFGESYRTYQQAVPRLVPWRKSRICRLLSQN